MPTGGRAASVFRIDAAPSAWRHKRTVKVESTPTAEAEIRFIAITRPEGQNFVCMPPEPFKPVYT
jgi:hypothetical protein